MCWTQTQFYMYYTTFHGLSGAEVEEGWGRLLAGKKPFVDNNTLSSEMLADYEQDENGKPVCGILVMESRQFMGIKRENYPELKSLPFDKANL